MLGAHQAQNAAVALASLDALVEQGFTVEPEDVARGFAGLSWPARVEVLREHPWIVVDGAHNVASAQALAETLRTSFPPLPITLVFGTTREKDMTGQLEALLPLASSVIATRYVENPRSVPPEEVAEAIRSFDGRSVHLAPGPLEALELARRLTPAHGLICVTGSLFLAAETRAIVLQRDDPLPFRSAMT
jgi:dihydrofolate synthase/folylpolyglutamate synthase